VPMHQLVPAPAPRAAAIAAGFGDGCRRHFWIIGQADGSFRSRKLIFSWDNVPMHRWAQSQMFRSLAFYLSEDKLAAIKTEISCAAFADKLKLTATNRWIRKRSAGCRARCFHRGRTTKGIFFRPLARLGFRRLSIIDLAGGHQPMPTRTKRCGLFSTERFTTTRNCAPSSRAVP